MQPEAVDLLIEHGTIVTMDAQNHILEDGALAVRDGAIVAIGAPDDIRARYDAGRVVNGRRKVVMPGLIDSYGHAGHGLIKGLWRPDMGWPSYPIYFHAADERWWFAEGLLSAVERLRFGVTCGYSVVGATPARMDSPIYAASQARAIQEVGVRAMLGAGPPDPFIPHIPEPWQATQWEGDTPHRVDFTFDETVRNTEAFARAWHGKANGRIHASLHYPYLFGRQASHPRYPFAYEKSHIPVMLERAREMRALADELDMLLHTHAFRGSVAFAVEHFGKDETMNLLNGRTLFAHCNGLAEGEVRVLGEARVGIAAVPFTHENIWYGPCPVIELMQAGAITTLATDGTAPYTSYDLWRDLSRGIWAQWQRTGDLRVLPPGKALRMVTIDAARALGLDSEIGSLEVGKRADIILIDLDRPHLIPAAGIFRLLVFYVNGNDVHTVIVDGEILMEDRVVRSVDEAAVRDLARERAAIAFSRYDISPYLEKQDSFWDGHTLEEGAA